MDQEKLYHYYLLEISHYLEVKKNISEIRYFLNKQDESRENLLKLVRYMITVPEGAVLSVVKKELIWGKPSEELLESPVMQHVGVEQRILILYLAVELQEIEADGEKNMQKNFRIGIACSIVGLLIFLLAGLYFRYALMGGVSLLVFFIGLCLIGNYFLTKKNIL